MSCLKLEYEPGRFKIGELFEANDIADLKHPDRQNSTVESILQ